MTQESNVTEIATDTSAAQQPAGFFTALSGFVRHAKLNLIISAGKDGTMSVILVPEPTKENADPALRHPMRFAGNPAELDASLISGLQRLGNEYESLAQFLDAASAVMADAKKATADKVSASSKPAKVNQKQAATAPAKQEAQAAATEPPEANSAAPASETAPKAAAPEASAGQPNLFEGV